MNRHRGPVVFSPKYLGEIASVTNLAGGGAIIIGSDRAFEELGMIVALHENPHGFFMRLRDRAPMPFVEPGE